LEFILHQRKSFSPASKMTRITLIAGTYQPHHCGVADYTQHLCQYLQPHNINTTVLTTCSAAQALSQPDVLSVVQNWSIPELIPLVRAIYHTSTDVLHIQHAAGTYGFDRAIFLLPRLLRLTGWRKPIVSTIHEYGWWEWQPKWLPTGFVEWLKTWGQSRTWWDREDGFLLTDSDAIITTNRNATEVIHTRLPKLRANVVEIPIGANIQVADCDRAQARQILRQQYGWADDTLVIAFFGFLHPVKGLETLLPAFQQVLVTHENARLILIGGVESLALPYEQANRYWHQLDDKIAALNLQNFVQMTGYVEDTIASRYLSGADIGVLPFNHGVTLKSGSLLALMAHSLPVVATRSTPPDLDLDPSLIRFVTPRNIDELTMELSHLLKDANLRKELGEKGRGFSQQFTWDAIAQSHIEIYQKLCS